MVILSAVIAAVVSQVGLGSEPAFKVPEYDFRSPTGTSLNLTSLNCHLLCSECFCKGKKCVIDPNHFTQRPPLTLSNLQFFATSFGISDK